VCHFSKRRGHGLKRQGERRQASLKLRRSLRPLYPPTRRALFHCSGSSDTIGYDHHNAPISSAPSSPAAPHGAVGGGGIATCLHTSRRVSLDGVLYAGFTSNYRAVNTFACAPQAAAGDRSATRRATFEVRCNRRSLSGRAQARPCLSVCRACRPRLRKDERNRNPIPTSSESGEEQPSFLKQSLDAGCTTRVCLPSPLPHPSTPPLSLCRLSQRPRSRPMTILDVKEVACRPMVVDGLSVITSRYENRGLNRPCAGTGSALVVTHNAAAWALDSRLTPHSLALHPLRSVRARLHFARRCRVNL
jgi:hypothetical protein